MTNWTVYIGGNMSNVACTTGIAPIDLTITDNTSPDARSDLDEDKIFDTYTYTDTEAEFTECDTPALEAIRVKTVDSAPVR